MIKNTKQCVEQDKTSLRLSNESNLFWEKHFQKNTLPFRIYAHFEADNEINNSSIGKKTTNIYKQNPVLNGYLIISEFDDILNSGFYEFPLDFKNVDWFGMK